MSDDAGAYRSLVRFVNVVRDVGNLRVLDVQWISSTRVIVLLVNLTASILL